MNWNGIIPGVIAIWFISKKWLNDMARILEPVIQEAERQAQDGLIDKTDRKKLVMMAIEELQKAGNIKISPLTRLILPFIVDFLANKLPNYNVTKGAKEAFTIAKFDKQKGV